MPKILWSAFVGIFATAFFLSTPGLRAQTTATNPGSDWQFGYDLFQMLLEERGLEISRSFVPAFDHPEETVLVVTGTHSSINSQVRNALNIYVDAGGSMLLLSDGPLICDLGQIQSARVTTTRPQRRYRGFDDCILLTRLEFSEELEGIDAVVANRASWFLPKQGTLNWKTLVSFPESQVRPFGAQGQTFLALGRSKVNPAGVAVVASDASLFTNGMLWHGDNSVLAIRIAELLTDGSRSKLVFATGSSFLPSYKEQLNAQGQVPPLPEPTLDRMLRLANAVARDVQASNVANEALANRPRRVSPKTYYRILLAILAALFLLAMLWLILRSGIFQNLFVGHRKMRASYQILDMAYGDNGDYRSAASYLAREFCFELTGSQQSNEWLQYWVDLRNRLSPDDFTPAEINDMGEVIDVASRGFQSQLSSREFQDFGRRLANLRTKNILLGPAAISS